MQVVEGKKVKKEGVQQKEGYVLSKVGDVIGVGIGKVNGDVKEIKEVDVCLIF